MQLSQFSSQFTTGLWGTVFKTGYQEKNVLPAVQFLRQGLCPVPTFSNISLQVTLLCQAAKIGSAVGPATVGGKDMEDIVRPIQGLGLAA